MRKSLLVTAMIMFILVAFTACQHAGASRSAGDVIDDTTINTEVKAKLLKDEFMKGVAVNVDTYQGTVILRGTVDTQDQVTRAAEITRSVKGVKKVDNKLTTKGR